MADGLEEPAGDVPIALLPGDAPPVALVLPPEEPKKRDSVTLLTDVEGAVEEGKVTKRDARKARQAKVSSHLFFCIVILQKSMLTQICQRILYISNSRG